MTQGQSPRLSRWLERSRVSRQYVLRRLRGRVDDLGKMYFVLALLMRLPASMLALSLLVLMSTRTNEITLGGYGAGIIMLSSGAMVSAYLWLAQRTSNRIVLSLAATLNIPAVVFMLFQALQFSDISREEHFLPFFLSTLIVGVTIAPFSALIRLHWSKVFNLTGDRQQFNSAIALESILDIIAIPVGALATGLISLVVSPEWSVISVIVINSLCLNILLWLPKILEARAGRNTRYAPVTSEGTHTLRWVPLAGFACLGLLLGSTESALTAFTISTDSVQTVGFYLAVLGVSSMLVGGVLLYFRVTFSSWRTWLISGIILIYITMPLSIFTGAPGLIIMLALLGGGLGFALICMDSVASSVAPRAILGLTLTFMQITYNGGLALGLVWGAVIGGRISFQASLLIPLIAAALFFGFGQLFGYYWRQAFEEKLPPVEV